MISSKKINNMAGIKGMKGGGGAHNTKKSRGAEKVSVNIRLTLKDRDSAREKFGSVAKAVEWAVDATDKKIKG